MGDEKAALREVHWRQLFPWLAIFRTFGIALDFKKMALGALGAILMASGWWLLANLFEMVASGNEQVQSSVSIFARWPWNDEQWNSFRVSAADQRLQRVLVEYRENIPIAPRRELEDTIRDRRGRELVNQLLANPLQTLWHLGTNWGFVLAPVTEFVKPFRDVFSRGTGFVPMVFTLLCGVWAAVVWAFFGGAITRIAAVQFAREEKISLKESLRFASSKCLSFGGAPIIPLAFIVFFWLLCAAGGLISRIPMVGSIFAGVLWILPLIAGFVMALILVGWSVGWPLMYATISVEGSDSFDALSRSFAYAFQRPWHYLFYALLAAVFGSLCSFFVILFSDLVVDLSRWAVSWGGGERLATMLDQLFYYAPIASGWRPGTLDTPVEAPTGVTWFAAVCTAVWLYLLFFMIVGFVYSYFWSASTIIYYLLRRDVDNTEMQEVYVEGEEEAEGTPAEPAPTSPVVTPSQATGGQPAN
jgi:hypothetical protein